MSLKGKATSAPSPLLKNALTAPVVYFDHVVVWGASPGSVEVELAVRILMPEADGTVTPHLSATAHLRCSPQAAAALHDALAKACAMAEQKPALQS
jgi:hypothetical protein